MKGTELARLTALLMPYQRIMHRRHRFLNLIDRGSQAGLQSFAQCRQHRPVFLQVAGGGGDHFVGLLHFAAGGLNQGIHPAGRGIDDFSTALDHRETFRVRFDTALLIPQAPDNAAEAEHDHQHGDDQDKTRLIFFSI